MEEIYKWTTVREKLNGIKELLETCIKEMREACHLPGCENRRTDWNPALCPTCASTVRIEQAVVWDMSMYLTRVWRDMEELRGFTVDVSRVKQDLEVVMETMQATYQLLDSRIQAIIDLVWEILDDLDDDSFTSAGLACYRLTQAVQDWVRWIKETKEGK